MPRVDFVTLRDGSKVPGAICVITKKCLKTLEKSRYEILLELVNKCKDANYVFSGDLGNESKKIFQKRLLINEKGDVYEAVRRIVLNAIDEGSGTLKLINPIKKGRIVHSSTYFENADNSWFSDDDGEDEFLRLLS